MPRVVMSCWDAKYSFKFSLNIRMFCGLQWWWFLPVPPKQSHRIRFGHHGQTRDTGFLYRLQFHWSLYNSLAYIHMSADCCFFLTNNLQLIHSTANERKKEKKPRETIISEYKWLFFLAFFFLLCYITLSAPPSSYLFVFVLWVPFWNTLKNRYKQTEKE